MRTDEINASVPSISHLKSYCDHHDLETTILTILKHDKTINFISLIQYILIMLSPSSSFNSNSKVQSELSYQKMLKHISYLIKHKSARNTLNAMSYVPYVGILTKTLNLLGSVYDELIDQKYITEKDFDDYVDLLSTIDSINGFIEYIETTHIISKTPINTNKKLCEPINILIDIIQHTPNVDNIKKINKFISFGRNVTGRFFGGDLNKVPIDMKLKKDLSKIYKTNVKYINKLTGENMLSYFEFEKLLKSLDKTHN